MRDAKTAPPPVDVVHRPWRVCVCIRAAWAQHMRANGAATTGAAARPAKQPRARDQTTRSCETSTAPAAPRHKSAPQKHTSTLRTHTADSTASQPANSQAQKSSRRHADSRQHPAWSLHQLRASTQRRPSGHTSRSSPSAEHISGGRGGKATPKQRQSNDKAKQSSDKARTFLLSCFVSLMILDRHYDSRPTPVRRRGHRRIECR